MMKKNIFKLILPLVVIGFLLACNEGPKGLIVKKWQISDVKSAAIDEMVAKSAQDTGMGAMMGQMMKQMLDAMKGATMEFTKDGKYSTVSKMEGKEEKEEGTYEVSEDGKKLTTTDKSGKKTVVSISELSAEKLSLKMDDDGKDLELIMTPAK